MKLLTFSLCILIAFVSQSNGQRIIGAVIRDFNNTFPDVWTSSKDQVDLGIPQLLLGADRKPVFNGTLTHATVSYQGRYFVNWFNDNPIYSKPYAYNATFTTMTTDANAITWGTNSWFPTGTDGAGTTKNYMFSFELHSVFTFVGYETLLTVQSTNDAFLFINNKLVVDLGGAHKASTATVNITALNLTPGNVYNFDLFYFSRSDNYNPTLIVSTHFKLDCATQAQDMCGVCYGDGGSCCPCQSPPNSCTITKCQSRSSTVCVNTTRNCDDSNACSVDTCNPSTGVCDYTSRSCDDNNVCTVDSCDSVLGCLRTPVNCDDGNLCTIDSCNPSTGCTFTAINCDDGDTCTYDSCNAYTGCSNVRIDCNDQNACTIDSCDTSAPDIDVTPNNGNTTMLTLAGKWLIIPMDNTYQGTNGVFNIKAYGLIVALLHNNTWVHWIIKNGKAKGDIDFSCTVTRIRPLPGASSNVTIGLSSGPFAVAPQFYDQALKIVDEYNSRFSGSDKVNVYQLITPSTVPVRHTLLHKPYVALLNSGTLYTIQEDYMLAAGMTSDHYKIVSGTEAQQVSGTSCFTIATEPHFDSSGAADPTIYPAAMRKFLASGGNFLAECHGILSYENGDGKIASGASYGWFITSRGITKNNTNNAAVQYYYNDLTAMQFDGEWDANNGGSLDDWGFVNSGYVNNGRSLIVNTGNYNQAIVSWGKLYANRKGTEVFYMGSHSYSSTDSVQVNGVRLYLNAVLTPSDRGISCPHLDICANIQCPTGKKDCINTPITCNDNNLCTVDSCDPKSGCLYSPISCDDNNACTTDSCDPTSGCVHTPVSCDDSNMCTTDTCSSSSGCSNTPIICNDNNACTNDQCLSGSGCSFTNITCNDNSLCTTDSCNTASGCSFVSITCNDNNACTSDSCEAATGCVYSNITCNDNNACTSDSCNAATGCVYTPIICNDNNACTSDSCDSGTGCINTPITCNDNNACTNDTCKSTTGCTYVSFSYDDSNACTIDACDSLTGVSHTPISCDDGLPCTVDTCSPTTGCVHTAKDCSDSDPCTIDSCSANNGTCIHEVVGTCACQTKVCPTTDYCYPAYCDPTTAGGDCVNTTISCNDGNACTVDSCYNGTCTYTSINCDDSNGCTIDACSGGICTHTNKTCDDGNACTVDSCTPATGACAFTPIVCDDSNACTTDACVNGACVYTNITCTDGNPCTTDSCVAGVCQFTAVTCNDNDACTTDACVGGTCVFTQITCNDGNPCTTDSCSGGVCVFAPVVCDDSNACTTDSCNITSGQCNFVGISCDDSNACTTDTCVDTNNQPNCTFTPKSCDDSNPCTVDSCNVLTGNCVHTTVSCDDNNLCTSDSCDVLTGLCTYTSMTCSSDACLNETCVAGVCVSMPVSCDDNDACTTDACVSVNGEARCTHDYTLCVSLNACATSACNKTTGQCQLFPVNCDDSNACTLDTCQDVNGTAVCQNTLLSCDDGNACTVDTCDPSYGCNFTLADASSACNDANVCTQDFCNQTGGYCYYNTTEVPAATDLCLTQYCDPTFGLLTITKQCGQVELCSCDPLRGCVCQDDTPALTAAEVGGIAAGTIALIAIGATIGAILFTISSKKAYDFYKRQREHPTNIQNNPLYEQGNNETDNPLFEMHAKDY